MLSEFVLQSLLVRYFCSSYQVMYYVSFLHEICCLANAWATNNHRFAFFNAIEYTWDQFDWMDKIVRPGLEEALIRMYLKYRIISRWLLFFALDDLLPRLYGGYARQSFLS